MQESDQPQPPRPNPPPAEPAAQGAPLRADIGRPDIGLPEIGRPDIEATTTTVPVASPRAGRRGRRLGILALACALPVLLTAGALGAAWTGYRLYDQPFAWYNLNRIAAVADRSSRTIEGITVVALGDGALRDATLDERAMAELGRREGIGNLHFLRIVKDDAEFDDFTPMLDRILALKPDLVLLDLDLGFRERHATADAWRYMDAVTGFALEGQEYFQDQMAVQYRRACPDGGAAQNGATPATMATPGAVAERMSGALDVRADSTSFARLQGFAERAGQAGIRVALVQLRRSPDLEERLRRAGAPDPALLEKTAAGTALPLWRFPEEIRRDADYCGNGGLGPKGREAYSAWMAGTIAETLGITPADEVALSGTVIPASAAGEARADSAGATAAADVTKAATVLPGRKPAIGQR
ncbi:hypothetical protein [Azospirillum sp. SYSU D00513]|uniref:hypothetical protein n=1 Tax=Azospirillum sp. SYSU D00513 TaxID=2812561 RepID=UPI001A9710BF|nr:hypothetical protein [Azospirillum sp. SYSU D00513]